MAVVRAPDLKSREGRLKSHSDYLKLELFLIRSWFNSSATFINSLETGLPPVSWDF